MSQLEGTIRCDGCGVEIPLSPVLIGRLHYCCKDCANGLICDCAKQVEFEDIEQGKTILTSMIEMYM
jgi:hypothetical protein